MTNREKFKEVFAFKPFPERLVEPTDPDNNMKQDDLRLMSWWDDEYESPDEVHRVVDNYLDANRYRKKEEG